MEMVTRYKAVDGELFVSAEECEQYEAELSIESAFCGEVYYTAESFLQRLEEHKEAIFAATGWME